MTRSATNPFATPLCWLIAASLVLLLPLSGCLPDRVDALEADLAAQQTLIEDLESRLQQADEQLEQSDALLVELEERATRIRAKNPPGADLTGCVTEEWVEMQGYARLTDLEPLATESYVSDAIDATTCPTIADAGPDQSLSSTDSTCSQDAYGNWTCTACVVDATIEAAGAASSGGLGYTWTVLSGTATLTHAEQSNAILSVTVSASEPGVTTTDTVEVELTATDCLAGTASDTLLVTVECTPPVP